MKTILYKVLPLFLVLSMSAGILPQGALVTRASAAETVSYDNQPETTAEKKRQQLEEQHHLTDKELQSYLDQGFTLGQVEAALTEADNTGEAFKEVLSRTSSPVVNNSNQAEGTVVNASSFTPSETVSAASTTQLPDYSYVNTKPEDAPYSIKLDEETVSTLSGGLSVQAVDVTLPGRNGMSFTLTRSYDSDDSQIMQPSMYNGSYAPKTPTEEMMNPIGKGWRWNIPYMEITTQDKYIHLPGSGAYKIVDNQLVGYAWRDLTFAQINQTINGDTAVYSLTSLQGVTQYFSGSGNLLQISDAYGNKITFGYAYNTDYSNILLSSISNDIGNSINITYSFDAVVLTQGTKTVTYKKLSKDGQEYLTQVIDPLGRKTTYDYSLKDANLNLTGTVPLTPDPYALLTAVTHPTGAKSVYTYETAPVTRYIKSNAVNQFYRAKSREDWVTKADGSVDIMNHKDFTYAGDMGSSYYDIASFAATINDGLSLTTFTYKKQFVNDNQSAFYNTSITAAATNQSVTYTNTTVHTYDEVRHLPVPDSTVVTESKTGSSATDVTTNSKTYDDYGNVTSETDALGVSVTYTYDVNHLLIGVNQPIQTGRTLYTKYTRDLSHPSKVILEQTFDGGPSGTKLSETGYESIDSYGNVGQIRIKNGSATDTVAQIQYASTYQYAFPTQTTIVAHDVDGNLQTIVKQYAYNAATGQLTTYTDANNNQISYVYDALGRVTQVTQPDSSVQSIEYRDLTNEIIMTDETGSKVITKWNPLGWKSEMGIFDGGIYKSKAKYGYDVYGRLIWAEDAVGNHTSYGYDQWSRQNVITYPDGATSYNNTDDIANTVTAVDGEGYALKEVYDKLNRVIRRDETKIAGSGSVTNTLSTMTYDFAGHMLSQTDAAAVPNTTNFSYDVLGRLSSVTNAKNETTSYSYDMLGNLTQITYPDNKTSLKKYDEAGRLIQTTDENGKLEKTYYDLNGNAVKSIDRNGNRFKFTFNNRNLLTQRETTDGSWNAIVGEEKLSYTYDLTGKRKTMTDGTGTTAYEYNAATGLLTKVMYPDGRSVQYDYDINGNRRGMTDPFGVTTYYHYDSRNRLDTVADSSNFENDYEAKYTYYKNDLLKQITEKNGTTSGYTYDGLRVGSVQQKKADGSTLNTFSYAYDNNGNQTGKTENGSAYSFTYDTLNRIATSSQFNETFTYDNRGNRINMTSDNPFDSPGNVYSYDKQNRLTTVAKGNEASVNYRYNGDGLLWERTEKGQTTRYYWDGDQMIAEADVSRQIVDNTSASIQYTGSWTTQNDAGDFNGSMSYTSTANNSAQMTFSGTTVQVAVRKGISGGKADIVLDGVIVATDIDTFSSTAGRQQQAVIYSNDSLSSGSHTIKVVVKGTQNASATTANVMLDYIAYGTGTTTLKARYIRGNGLIARENTDGKAYYMQNGHGDVVNLMDSTGMTSLNSYAYDIWGNIVSQAESVQNPFKYSGEFWDNTSGLQYLRARWYDPSMGRFINEDTYEGQIDNPLTLNLYTYVENNPLTHVDPSGHSGTLTLFAHSNHAWIAYTPDDSDTTNTFGTWGNQGEKGIYTNIEAISVANGNYDGRVSLTIHISDDQEKQLQDFMDTHNDWGYMDNCSYFAEGAWESAGGEALNIKNSIGWNTPSALARSIKTKAGYQVNAPITVSGSSNRTGSSSSSTNPSSSLFDSYESSVLGSSSGGSGSAGPTKDSGSSAF